MNPTLLGAISIYWHLPIVIVLVSMIYSATRFEQWGAIFLETVRWGLRITTFLVGVSVLLYVVTLLI
jgi:hypothetical protein